MDTGPQASNEKAPWMLAGETKMWWPEYRIPDSAELSFNGAVLAVGSLPLEWDVGA